MAAAELATPQTARSVQTCQPRNLRVTPTMNYRSYALIATHSPIVLQEIPRKRVLVLTRDGDVITSESLETESFGQSISELTRHVFETNEIENLYKTTLADLADEESVERTLARFDGELSQNAFAYLLAKHAGKPRR
jgi:hypothetical protein